jgi:hypothetical protein
MAAFTTNNQLTNRVDQHTCPPGGIKPTICKFDPFVLWLLYITAAMFIPAYPMPVHAIFFSAVTEHTANLPLVIMIPLLIITANGPLPATASFTGIWPGAKVTAPCALNGLHSNIM